ARSSGRWSPGPPAQPMGMWSCRRRGCSRTDRQSVAAARVDSASALRRLRCLRPPTPTPLRGSASRSSSLAWIAQRECIVNLSRSQCCRNPLWSWPDAAARREWPSRGALLSLLRLAPGRQLVRHRLRIADNHQHHAIGNKVLARRAPHFVRRDGHDPLNVRGEVLVTNPVLIDERQSADQSPPRCVLNHEHTSKVVLYPSQLVGRWRFATQPVDLREHLLPRSPCYNSGDVCFLDPM